MATRRLPTAPTFMPQQSAARSNVAVQGQLGGVQSSRPSTPFASSGLAGGWLDPAQAPTREERLAIRQDNGFRPFQTPATAPPGATMADSPRVPAGGGGVASAIAPTWSQPTVQQSVQQAGLASTGTNPTVGRVQGTSSPQYMTNANNAPTAGVAALAAKPIIQQPMAAAPAAVAGPNPAKKLGASDYARPLEELYAEPDPNRALNAMMYSRAGGLRG